MSAIRNLSGAPDGCRDNPAEGRSPRASFTGNGQRPFGHDSHCVAFVLSQLRDDAAMERERAEIRAAFVGHTQSEVADKLLDLRDDDELVRLIVWTPEFVRRCIALALSDVVRHIDDNGITIKHPARVGIADIAARNGAR